MLDSQLLSAAAQAADSPEAQLLEAAAPAVDSPEVVGRRPSRAPAAVATVVVAASLAVAVGLAFGGAVATAPAPQPRQDGATSLRGPSAAAAPVEASEVAEALLDERRLGGRGGAPVAAGEVLAWLRAEPFNLETERALEHHPLALAADNGTMPLSAAKFVLLEEYSIEQSDLRSMAAALARFGGLGEASRSFFLTSQDSEHVAATKLLAAAKALNMSESVLSTYQPRPAAHAYSAYLAQLSNYGGAAAIAAGFAVNFPTWGRMCGRIYDGLLRPPLSMPPSEVDFFKYFADPIPGFDDQATAVIAEGMANGETAESIKSAVMLLQGYELMFWDTVWAEATK